MLILKYIMLALLVLISGTSPSWAELKNENLLVTLPPGYTVGSNQAGADLIIQEWVPQGQTVNEWTDMVTVQIFLDKKDLDDKSFANSMGKLWSGACHNSTVSAVISGQGNHYPISIVGLRCPLNPDTGKTEYTLVKAIRGDDSLYTVQKAFRFEPTQDQINQWWQYLNGVYVCDTRSTVHPCPDLKAQGFKQIQP